MHRKNESNVNQVGNYLFTFLCFHPAMTSVHPAHTADLPPKHSPRESREPVRAVDPAEQLRSFLEDLENTIAVARTLMEDGHTVDLTGFDRQIGLLCAKALDLPPEQGRLFRDELAALLPQIEALACTLTSLNPGV
jgi:hypothetical protein